jgi:hypothetical protein
MDFSEPDEKNRVIARRCYVVRRDGQDFPIRFEMTAPYPSKDIFKTSGAACRVFYHPEEERGREILGRDCLEALCHSILSIEARLLLHHQRGELFNEDGSKALPGDFALFFGSIGKPYRDEFGSTAH